MQTSLLGAALSFGATYMIEEALTGIGRTPIGNRSFVNGPTDMFRTSDGWIVTQVVGDALFRRWADLIEEPQWLSDPRFSTDELRGVNGAALSDRMAAWCKDRDSAEALDALGRAGIPAGPVLSPAEANSHPQIRALGLVDRQPYPGLGEPAPLMRLPLHMAAAAPIRRPPPRPGEHNAEILVELGYSAARIAALTAAGAI